MLAGAHLFSLISLGLDFAKDPTYSESILALSIENYTILNAILPFDVRYGNNNTLVLKYNKTAI